MGLELSGLSFPFRIKEIRMGVRVMARKASIISINVFVQARGWKSLPSMPVSKKTGRNEVITTMVE